MWLLRCLIKVFLETRRRLTLLALFDVVVVEYAFSQISEVASNTVFLLMSKNNTQVDKYHNFPFKRDYLVQLNIVSGFKLID